MSTPSQNESLAVFSDALAALVEKAGEATVLVNARRRLPGSGIAYAEDLVVTADHVVEREEDISIYLADGRKIQAAVAGRDPARDLALLRLTEKVLTPAERTAASARVGNLVLAVARPDTTGPQASLGTISAIGGPVRVGHGVVLESYIRSDAYPFPGFSGGPLVNIQGQVVGLNTSAMAAGSLLTIPSQVVWEAAQSLMAHGHIRRGYIGIRSQPVRLAPVQVEALGRSQQYGLLLVSIEGESPAAQAGLMTGDIVVGINQQPVQEHDELQAFLSGDAIGKGLPVEVLRGSTKQVVSVTVAERK